MKVSQPARAVWIEIYTAIRIPFIAVGHSLRGLCGLKSKNKSDKSLIISHSLRGLCGLKFHQGPHICPSNLSQPARAVWIEINPVGLNAVDAKSQPARAVWIEINE